MKCPSRHCLHLFFCYHPRHALYPFYRNNRLLKVSKVGSRESAPERCVFKISKNFECYIPLHGAFRAFLEHHIREVFSSRHEKSRQVTITCRLRSTSKPEQGFRRFFLKKFLQRAPASAGVNFFTPTGPREKNRRVHCPAKTLE